MDAAGGRGGCFENTGSLFTLRTRNLQCARPSLHDGDQSGRRYQRFGKIMSKYSVAVDVRMWNHPGIGRYIRELTKQPAYRSFENKIYFLGRAQFKNEILSGGSGDAFKEASSGIYGLAEQFEIPLKAGGADLLHVPHFNVPLLFRGKLVATIHDLIYVRGENTLRSGAGRPFVRFFTPDIDQVMN